MMKKFFSTILTAAMMLSLMPFSAAAEETFAVSDFLYADFETPETSGSVIYSAEKTWVAEGFGGSRGAVKMKNNDNNMGGVAFKQEYRAIVGETYEISILGKPPADNPDALNNGYAVAYYRYLVDGVPTESFSGYHLIYLTNKEDVGDGWFRYSAPYTVTETCRISGGTPTIYGTTCTFEYRAKNTNIEYMLDEFICKPAYSVSSDDPVVLNANFDDSNPSHWVMDNTVEEIRTDGGANGSQNYVYITSGHPHSSIQYNNVMITPATAYKVSWHAKIGKPEDSGKYYAGVYLSFNKQTAGELPNYPYLQTDRTLTNEWQYFECIYRPLASSTQYIADALNIRPSFFFRLNTENTGTGDIIADYCLDEIKIERLPAPYGGDFEAGFGISAVNTKTTKVAAWFAGVKANVSDITEQDNSYITVEQADNSGTDGQIGTGVYLESGKRYLLRFCAKSDGTDAALTPVLSMMGAAGETVERLETAMLSSEWQTYEMSIMLPGVTSTCQLKFLADDGENVETIQYCLDDVSIVEAALRDAQTSGEFSAGSTVSASVANDIGSTLEYRVMTSSDGIHFAKLAGGTAEGNTACYTISDNDAGNFLRFDFFTVSNGTISNLISTQPREVTGVRVYFTTTDFDAAETLSACATIKNSALEDKNMTLLLAVYGSKSTLLDMVSKPLSSEEISAGTAKISLTKPTGALRAKVFLWEDLDSVMPYTTSEEIKAGLSVDQIVDTLQQKAVTKTPGYEIVSEIETGYDDVSAILFDGLPYNGGDTQIFAYMGIPESADVGQKVPAVVLIHGNASRLYPSWVKSWVDKGYAAIACYMMDRNTELDPNVSYNQGPRQPSGYYTDIDLPLEDQYMYHAVASAILAKNLLANLPQVDASKIGITGISNGSMIASYAIGVDPGFAFAVPVYNSGYLNEGGVNKGLTGKRMLWDAKNVLSNVTIPTLFINGNAASMYAIDQNTKSALDVKGSVISYQYGLGHSQPAGEAISEIFTFADSAVKGGPAFTKIGRVKVAENIASFAYETDNYISKIRFVYNTSGIQYDGSNSVTEWKQPVEINLPQDRSVSFALPSGTKGFYFELTDDACGIVTTEYVELEAAVQ